MENFLIGLNLLIELNKYLNYTNISNNIFKKFIGFYPNEFYYIIEKYNFLNYVKLRDLFITFNFLRNYDKNSFIFFNISRNRHLTIFLNTIDILFKYLDEV